MNARTRKKLMKRFRHRTAPGSAPGTLKSSDSDAGYTLRLTNYYDEHCTEKVLSKISEFPAESQMRGTYWLDATGLDNAELIEAIGKRFNLHPLSLEDAIHVHQRPKTEDYDSHLFIVARMILPGEATHTEQVSLFLSKNLVVTLQERDGDCFESVRERIRAHSRIRDKQADYLAYALLDAIIDNYFPRIEDYRERLELLEDALIKPNSPDAMGELHEIRRDLRHLRKLLWQHREATNSLLRLEHPLIQQETTLYIRDCHDHCVQLLDVTESYREYCTDLRDLYLAEISMRTNDVMKVLTLIATIFMPMSFIAGLYGMNFDHDESPYNMPETKWFYGYPFAILLMSSIGFGLLYFFYRKGWIGSSRG